MTQQKKFTIITLLWGVVLCILPKVNFWLSLNDIEITLLNGSKESVYYISWLLTYRYATPIIFGITWWLLVSNWEFKKWVIPVLVYSFFGILTTFISTRFYSWIIDLSFFITTLIIFFENKRQVIVSLFVFLISLLMAFSWYMSLIGE